jgi:uncharacterized protein YggT (Ycf19 family)
MLVVIYLFIIILLYYIYIYLFVLEEVDIEPHKNYLASLTQQLVRPIIKTCQYYK